MYKYGVNLMVWTTTVHHEHRKLLASIREWGFEGVELFLSPEEPADIPFLRQELTQLNLERTTCVVLPRDAHLPSPNVETRRRGVAFLNRCAERTAELEAHLMCGPLHSGLGVMTGQRRTEDEWNRSVESLQKVARRARELGVTLCVEPLNRFETYFLNTQADAARFIDEIGEPNVRVHYDTFHANIEEKDPVKALKALGTRAGHVHISESDRGTPGTGHVDWRGTLLALREIAYSGWLTIESFAQPEPQLASAACIWRDMAPSGESLARGGLAFMKDLASKLGINQGQGASA
jgi:D-psicose/D-tagatose/L-ribulose 3-epimerase